jgi:hypothetical protein
MAMGRVFYNYFEVVKYYKDQGYQIMSEGNGLNWVKMYKVTKELMRVQMIQWNNSTCTAEYISFDYGEVEHLHELIN